MPVFTDSTRRWLREQKRPSKAKLEAAVKAVQLLLGSRRGATMRVRDEQKLHDRAWKLVRGIATITGMDEIDVWNQVEAEARKRGLKTPLPGMDI